MRTLITILIFAVAATAAAVPKQEVGAEGRQAVAEFRHSESWTAGVDGSVALATPGAESAIDSGTAAQPIFGFVFSNQGLMHKQSFGGSKRIRVAR